MNQTDLFNYSTAPHNHTEPSIDAAESIVDQLNGMCRDVLHAVKSSPFGLTCDEVEKILDMKHQTASARLRDLITCQPPYVEFQNNPETEKPLRRTTRSGRTARVYFATQLGVE